MRFHIITMGRSGNHPIVYWLAKQFLGEVKCLFCVSYPQKYKTLPECCAVRLSSTSGPHYCFMATFEDKRFGQVYHLDKEYSPIQIVIVRDIYNLGASRICGDWKSHKTKRNMKDFDRTKKIWLEHANFALKYPNQSILFNKWFTDKQYRKSILKRWKPYFKFTDKGLNTVTSEGRYSSFDRDAYQGQAQKMKVLKRYTNNKARKTELMQNILKDQDLAQTNLALFGWNPFTINNIS